VSTWLLDTGPLVAYLTRDDPAHPEVAARLDDFAGRLITSSAVVTEAMHFLSPVRSGPRLLADFLAATATEVYDLSAPPELLEAVALMETYADTPMDFADATLLLLAEALGIAEILTLDRRGFSTFRTRDGRPLLMVLDRD